MVFFIASAAGVLSGSPSSFESGDGDMIKTPNTSNKDWKDVTFVKVTDSTSSTDDSFVGGDKQDTLCPDVDGHSNPPKDDFTAVASVSETQSSAPHHTFLYGATVRVQPNGNASENIELKQGLNGTCPGSPLLQRSAGDKLIAIDYLNGGTNVQFNVLTWVTSGACLVGSHTAPCWGANIQTLASNAAEGRASQTAITAANNPITNENLTAGRFAEFGIDLTAAGIIPENECKSFPQTIWESRAAGSSFTSQVKDISIENTVISNCGSIKIIKQTNPRGIDQVFSFTSNLPANSAAGGVACTAGGSAGIQANGNFCLNDSGNAGKTLGSSAADQNSSGNTVTETELFPGSYTVTEGADPSGFNFGSATCTASAGSSASTNGKAASITLGVNGVVVCVYQNNQELGAIKITKTSIKSGNGLDGATFSITKGGTAISGSPFTTANGGVICVPNLGFGGYVVTETAAPSGFAIDTTAGQTVTVDNNANCTDATYVGESIGFTDTPLADIQVRFRDGGSGETALENALSCDNATGTPSTTDTTGWDDTLTITGVKVDGSAVVTIKCTIEIDP
jgi:hypothetical protein